MPRSKAGPFSESALVERMELAQGKLRFGTKSVSNRLLFAFANNPLTVGLVFLAIGILIGEHFAKKLPYFALIILAISIYVANHFRRGKHYVLINTWSLTALIVLAGGWMHVKKMERVDRELALSPAPENWQPIHLRGVVDSIPRFRPDASSFAPRDKKAAEDEISWITSIDIHYNTMVESTELGQKEIKSQGRIRVSVPGRHRDMAPGDVVDCYLSWRKIPPPSNPGALNIAKRLRQQEIFAQGAVKSVTQLQRRGMPHWWRIDRLISRLAMAGDKALERYVWFGQAPLASALVLGQRDQIEWELQESLLETGTVHMLAISGLHVEMVAVSIAALCLAMRLGLRATLIIVASTVVIYAMICGAKPPVLRATFLVVAIAIARYMGVVIASMNLLSFAALILLMYRTDHLWDTGTQLSFLAVAMLICVATSTAATLSPLDQMLQSNDSLFNRFSRTLRFKAYNIVAVSSWVWLVTTPIVVFMFHIVAPAAIIMNLVLLIPLWIGLISGLAIVVIGSWVPYVGYLLGIVCGCALGFTRLAVGVAREIPGSHWWTVSPPFWWVVGFYVLLILSLLIYGFSHLVRRRIFGVLLLWIVVGLVPWAQIFPNNKVVLRVFSPELVKNDFAFAVTFIDVGHGTSIVIQTPDHKCWLYDAGQLGDPHRAFYPIANSLWYLQIPKIDKLILSHADADHFNAVPALARRFAIGEVVTTQQMLDSTDQALLPIFDSLRRREIPIQTVGVGQTLQSGDLIGTVLHPDPTHSGSDNADSLSLLIEFRGMKFLLPGDLEGQGIQKLLRLPPTKVDVLMAPHHGSLTDDPSQLLGWAKPDHVVISGGARSARTKVLKAFSGSAGRDVWVTARDHAIRFEYAINADNVITERILHWSGVSWAPLAQRPPEGSEATDEENYDVSF